MAALDKSSIADKSKSFVEVAKKVANKNLKEITLQNIGEKDLLPDVSVGAFKLAKNQFSLARFSAETYRKP